LTDFDEIWHGAADWPPIGDRPLKFPFFSKTKMAAAAMLKIRKIAISPQRFDRSLRNLASLCKMGLLAVLTVKNLNFQNPKWLTAAMKNLLNHHISATVVPILMKFGTVTQICPMHETDR